MGFWLPQLCVWCVNLSQDFSLISSSVHVSERHMNPKMNSWLHCVYYYNHGNKVISREWCAHCSAGRDPEILTSCLGDLWCGLPGSHCSLNFTSCFSNMCFNPRLHRFRGWGSSALPTDHMVPSLNALTRDIMESDLVLHCLYKLSTFLLLFTHKDFPTGAPPRTLSVSHLQRELFKWHGMFYPPGRAFSITRNVLPGPLIVSLISQEYYRFPLCVDSLSPNYPKPLSSLLSKLW